MITRTAPRVQPTPWQTELRLALRSRQALLDYLGVADSVGLTDPTPAGFPILAPRPLVARIAPDNPADPILRQLLSDPQEQVVAEGYVTDPVGDQRAQRLPGLLHKYRTRVLLMLSDRCALHCRFCFRRALDGAAMRLPRHGLDAAVDYIRAHPEIDEVILSGGDPLLLSDERLAETLRRLDALPGLRAIRIHTRMPIAIPQRITPALVRLLSQSRARILMAIHSNHAQEWDESVERACSHLTQGGIRLLSQSVLLRGINDSVSALEALMLCFDHAGVTPYYLHQLDRVRGAHHFALADSEALELVQALRSRLAGYLIPRLVREVAGAPAKLPLAEATSMT